MFSKILRQQLNTAWHCEGLISLPPTGASLGSWARALSCSVPIGHGLFGQRWWSWADSHRHLRLLVVGSWSGPTLCCDLPVGSRGRLELTVTPSFTGTQHELISFISRDSDRNELRLRSARAEYTPLSTRVGWPAWSRANPLLAGPRPCVRRTASRSRSIASTEE
jgi:hypothetical protein